MFCQQKGVLLSCQGKWNTLPMGITWLSFHLYSIGERELGFKNTVVNQPSSKFPKPLSGWMGGEVDIKVIRFSSCSGIVKSKMSLFQIWHTKLSKTFTSKVINLSKNFLKCKADLRNGKQLNIMMVTKDFSPARKLRKVFQTMSKKSISGSNRWKNRKCNYDLKRPLWALQKELWALNFFRKSSLSYQKKNPSISPSLFSAEFSVRQNISCKGD